MRPEETSAAACVAGCTIVQAEGEDGRPRIEVECPSGWSAARFLLALARADAMVDPAVRGLVVALRRSAPSDGDFVRALHDFVTSSIAFERERGEIFQAPWITLERRRGDCDCHARLVFAALVAAGIPARLAFLHRGGDPLHVLAQAQIGGEWTWIETTIRKGGGARFGEHPLRAARRTGVIRDDVRGNMAEVFMGAAIGVEGGTVYRMRVGVFAPRDEASEGAIESALLRLGFTDVKVWKDRAELPADFAPHAKDDVPGAEWTAWAEALYARPESTMIDMPIDVPADAREGLVSIALDDVHALQRTPQAGASAPTTMGDVTIVHTRDLSPGFFVRLKEIARQVRINPEHALEVMWAESRLRSSAIHPTDSAAGIFGLMFPTRAEAQAFATKTAEDQLGAYARFMAPYRGLSLLSAANLYQVNFLPASAIPGSGHYRGTHPGAVLVARGGTGYGGKEDLFYRKNASLDADRDGRITVADLGATLQRARSGSARFAEALARLRAAPDPAGLAGMVALLPWLALGGAIWYTIKHG